MLAPVLLYVLVFKSAVMPMKIYTNCVCTFAGTIHVRYMLEFDTRSGKLSSNVTTILKLY